MAIRVTVAHRPEGTRLHRYQPFSGNSRLYDPPISRCGSVVLLFLEPKDLTT